MPKGRKQTKTVQRQKKATATEPRQKGQRSWGRTSDGGRINTAMQQKKSPLSVLLGF